MKKNYDFAAKEAQYAEYDLASLLFARDDAAKAEANFRGMDAENYYRDDFLTLCDIIRKRRAAGETITEDMIVDATGAATTNICGAALRLYIRPDWFKRLAEGEISGAGRKLPGQNWHGERQAINGNIKFAEAVRVSLKKDWAY
jgi:hypothetical protein